MAIFQKKWFKLKYMEAAKIRVPIWLFILFYLFIFLTEIEIKKLVLNTSLILISEIEIMKLELNNSLILILQK